MISEVYNIDCMEYMRSLPDKFFDLCVADPPYGGAGNDQEVRNEMGGFSKYKQNIKADRTGGDWAKKYGTTIKEWDVAPNQEFFEELLRVSDKVIIWGGNYFSLPPTRCFLVWRKLSIGDTFTMAMAEYAWTNMNDNAKVFEKEPQGKANDPRFHPTAKPIELYSWILKLFAKDGDKIFDPMMGSQSSRIAAYFSELDYFGCEINKEYFDKGNERFEKICYGVERMNGHTITQQSLW